MADTPTLGFIGIGIMGEAMVRRLLDRSWRVSVWNREPERLHTVLPHGAEAAASPAAVAEASDIVLLCVLDADAVADCVWGEAGIAAAARRPAVLIDLSTADPDRTEAMAARLGAAHLGAPHFGASPHLGVSPRPGIPWVDAPVSGGPAKARDGTLAIMAGGTAEAIATARPVLQALGRVTHLGPAGAGQRAKLVNQAIVGTGYVLMAEALAIAEAAGLDPAALPHCLAGGMADGSLLQVIFPQMASRGFNPPCAYARQLLKDMQAVRALARAHGQSLPVIEQAVVQYERWAGAGNTMQDSAAIALAYVSEAP